MYWVDHVVSILHYNVAVTMHFRKLHYSVVVTMHFRKLISYCLYQ